MSEKHDETPGYEIADDFIGQWVTGYTDNGASLRGILIKRDGKFVLVDKNKNARAILNLDKIISLTRR